MKLLSHIDCLEILPADIPTAMEAAERFPAILAASFLPNFYRTAFAEGWVNPSTVFLSGKKVGLVGWHRAPDGGLLIDCVIAFEPLPKNFLWTALEVIERDMKPTYVRFLTCRRALAHLAALHGFAAQAVMMQKSGRMTP